MQATQCRKYVGARVPSPHCIFLLSHTAIYAYNVQSLNTSYFPSHHPFCSCQCEGICICMQIDSLLLREPSREQPHRPRSTLTFWPACYLTGLMPYLYVRVWIFSLLLPLHRFAGKWAFPCLFFLSHTQNDRDKNLLTPSSFYVPWLEESKLSKSHSHLWSLQESKPSPSL